MLDILMPRPEPSRLMTWLSPVITLLTTLVLGSVLFWLLDKSPLEAFDVFFVQPLSSLNGWGELLLKASALILIAQGLAMCFRARIFNIGAEGQLIIGAICGGGVAIALQHQEGGWILPLMFLAGALGGALWAGLAALLKTHFGAEETLTTLMLNYIAGFLLLYLINGPWKDPDGQNFPQTILFEGSRALPIVLDGTRLNAAIFLTIAVVLVCWFMVARSFAVYRLGVGGLAPAAARYAGFSAKRMIWVSLMISGLLAGVAGVAEIAGPVGQLNPNISPGYGFAAIIVAYLGRLHPIGMVLSGLLIALLYLGGEQAQIVMQLPSAIAGLFQGMLLFVLLATDAFIDYQLRPRSAQVART